MKFFQSKYYTPVFSERNANNLIHNTNVSDDIILRDLSRLSPRDTKTMAMMNAFCERFTSFTNYELDINYIITECELVEDLTSVCDGNISVGIFGTEDLYNRVYFHTELEVFIYIAAHFNMFAHKNQVNTANIFIPNLVDKAGIIDKIKNSGLMIPYEEKKIASIGMLVQDGRGFNIRYNTIDDVHIDFDTMYHGDFKSVSDEILNHMSPHAGTGLIILHGTPGTGKTSYIRWLTGQSNRKMVFVPPAMVPNLTQPAFIEFLMHHKNLTFIVEDAEATLNPRMGSEHSIVSSILNMTDGLMGDVLRCQFICTFNTPLTNIDQALLRPGRLLVRHEFSKLTKDEANTYLESVGSEVRVDGEQSLAELMNIERPPVISKSEVRKSFGFMG